MLGYYGPVGTFTHQALLTLSKEDALPFDTVPRTLDAVRNGEVEAALVPIENSVEGGVSATLDNLASGVPLRIMREVLLPVRFVLAVRPGTKHSDIKRVITHPHAHAQTRFWIEQNLPKASVTEGGSTAAAAREVSDPESKFDAAICARVAADLYGLECLEEGIADNEGGVTRFVLVAKGGRPPEPTGSDKTTLVAYMHTDRAGALLEILEQFSVRGVNLVRIESRPTKKVLGDYCFSIDAEGHVLEPRMVETMKGLHRTCRKVKYLGSYPRADQVQPKLARGFSAEEFDAADEWFAEVIDRV